MPKKAHFHEKLDVSAKIVVATGLGGAGREYPDYYEKFDHITVEKIALEAEFLGLISQKEKIAV